MYKDKDKQRIANRLAKQHQRQRESMTNSVTLAGMTHRREGDSRGEAPGSRRPPRGRGPLIYSTLRQIFEILGCFYAFTGGAEVNV